MKGSDLLSKLTKHRFFFQRACPSQTEQKYFVSQYSVDMPEIIKFANEIRNELNWRTKTLELGPEEIKLPSVSTRILGALAKPERFLISLFPSFALPALFIFFQSIPLYLHKVS